MNEAILKVIEDAKNDLVELESKVTDQKKFINQLCLKAGQPAPYADCEPSQRTNLSAIRPDQFFGRPLATVAREYLEMRKASSLGAAALEDVFDALRRGGYAFAESDEDARRGLAISMAKNTQTFFRLPNGFWGLSEWYPNALRREKKSMEADQSESDETANEEATSNAEKDFQKTGDSLDAAFWRILTGLDLGAEFATSEVLKVFSKAGHSIDRAEMLATIRRAMSAGYVAVHQKGVGRRETLYKKLPKIREG